MEMKRVTASVLTVMLGVAPQWALAGQTPTLTTDKYKITAEERSACGSDAIELCSDAYPNEEKLLTCMKINRVSLSAACRPIFDDGMRRRHLN